MQHSKTLHSVLFEENISYRQNHIQILSVVTKTSSIMLNKFAGNSFLVTQKCQNLVRRYDNTLKSSGKARPSLPLTLLQKMHKS